MGALLQWSNRDLWLVVGTLVLTLLLTRTLRSWLGSWRARRRAQSSAAGERRAQRLLERAGYRVEGAQVVARWTLYVDGAPEVIVLRADFVCSRRGERFVVDAKTGASAPSIRDRATRRQLLEYLHAFGVSGVLLVDADRGRVHRVDFGGPPATLARALV